MECKKYKITYREIVEFEAEAVFEAGLSEDEISKLINNHPEDYPELFENRINTDGFFEVYEVEGLS
jgi:hypothetical protein